MISDFKCNNCGYVEEYILGPNFKNSDLPDVCPSCNNGKMEKIFSPQGVGFDIKGYCYDRVYGKKNWKKGKSDAEIASYLMKNPETGKYDNPY